MPPRDQVRDLLAMACGSGPWTHAIWRCPWKAQCRQSIGPNCQTVNRAELSACIAALRVAPRGQVLRIVTNSKYVYDGILKYLQQWQLQGRPFPNADLWQQLHSELSARTARTLWRHVYSHIGVVGSERADALANSGRLAHPQRRQFVRDQTVSAGRPPVVVRTACWAR